MRYFFTYYPLAGACGLVLSIVLMRWLYDSVLVPELLVGWLVAQLNGAAAHFLHRRIIRARSSRSFSVGLALNGLRFGLLLLLVLVVYLSGLCRFLPFFIAVTASYACLMVSQVLTLHADESQQSSTS